MDKNSIQMPNPNENHNKNHNKNPNNNKNNNQNKKIILTSELYNALLKKYLEEENEDDVDIILEI